MVVTLGPGKFYGSDLPRPRFYTDVKLNDHRVDPPLPVTDPLMSWAHDAHWSMGGLSFTRHRLQGRIEGNVDKLRAQRDNQQLDSPKINDSPSPSKVPVAIKRRRVVGLADDDDDDDEEFGVKRVDRESEMVDEKIKKRVKKLVKVGIRSSSRLAKKGG